MLSYSFEAVGRYVVIRKNSNGQVSLMALPSGVYSILPHISGDGRICLIKEVKTVNEKTYSSLSDEIQIHFADIASPKSDSVNDAIESLSFIFANESQANIGDGELQTNFEVTANASLRQIAEQLKEVVFLLKSISE